MYRAYKYTFYKLYIWYLNTFGKRASPQDSAMLIITALTFINILTVLAILQGITGINFMTIGEWPVEYLLLLAFIYMAIHHFILLYNKRYKNIIHEFEVETEEQRKKGTLWVVLYIIGTHLLLIISGFIIYDSA